MKKVIGIFTLLFMLTLSCSVFAASSPYEDVPANHWAYDSIAKLAKAGLVEGYSDGTFRGSKTITRYEMATIVANVITKEDKADDSMKTEIAKLKVEFSNELNQLGIRVSNVENRMTAAEKLQFKIMARQIFEHADNPAKNNNPTDMYYHYRFFMTTNLDPNAQFITMWESTDDINTNATTTSQGGNFTAKQAYLKAKVGSTGINLGRQAFSWLGNGLVCDNSGKWDGVTIEVGNNSRFTLRAGVAERYLGASNILHGSTLLLDGTSVLSTTPGAISIPAGTRTFYMYNAKYTVNPNLNFISVYLKDQGARNAANSSLYDSLSLGFNYNFDDKWTVMSEYAKNSADLAKAANNQKAPKGFYTQLKYNHVDQTKIGTWDIFTDYRKAESGFDLAGMSTLDNLKNWGLVSGANNVKGFDLVYEYVPFKNVVASLRGYNLKSDDNSHLNYKGYVFRLDYNY